MYISCLRRWPHSISNSSCTHLIKGNGDCFDPTLLSSCYRRTSGEFKQISLAKDIVEFSWPWQTSCHCRRPRRFEWHVQLRGLWALTYMRCRVDKSLKGSILEVSRHLHVVHDSRWSQRPNILPLSIILHVLPVNSSNQFYGLPVISMTCSNIIATNMWAMMPQISTSTPASIDALLNPFIQLPSHVNLKVLILVQLLRFLRLGPGMISICNPFIVGQKGGATLAVGVYQCGRY